VALDALAARPRKLEQALRGTAAPDGRAARLAWNPIRPLHGAGDWLERVRLQGATAGSRHEPEGLRRAREHFVPSGGGAGCLKNTWPEHPQRRLAVVNDLLALLGASGGEAFPRGNVATLRFAPQGYWKFEVSIRSAT
jgi:hypothetical protein